MFLLLKQNKDQIWQRWQVSNANETKCVGKLEVKEAVNSTISGLPLREELKGSLRLWRSWLVKHCHLQMMTLPLAAWADCVCVCVSTCV